MSTRTRRSPTRPNNPDQPDQPLAADQDVANDLLEQTLASLTTMSLEDLRSFAVRAARQVHHQKHRLAKAGQMVETVREEVAALTQPENHSVVITRVSLNGERLVEVAGPGGSRSEVSVHPEVPAEQLRIGHSGRLARERNCLLKVNGPHAEWRDVGAFEDYLDSARRRALVKCHEQLIAVTLSEDLSREPLRKGDLIGFDREGSGLAYHRVPAPDSKHLFNADIPEDHFDQLGGLKPTIARIKHCIDFTFKHPDLAARYRLPAKRGILLSGPPGNGKTRIARCVATYLNELMPGVECRFMAVTGSSDYSVWFGQSEQNLIQRFEAARAAAADGPVVIFFDEIDAIGKRRGSDLGSGAPDRVLNTFLGQLDGVRTIQNLIVIAATNRPDTLDPAVTRPGRFDVKLRIPRPSRATARAILLSYLEGLPLAPKHSDLAAADVIGPVLSRLFNPRGDYAELLRVRVRDGRYLSIPGRELVSGALLERVVSAAAEDAALREMETGTGGISDDDLTLALDLQLRSTAHLINAGNVKSYVATIPEQADPVSVEVTGRGADPTFDRPG